MRRKGKFNVKDSLFIDRETLILRLAALITSPGETFCLERIEQPSSPHAWNSNHLQKELPWPLHWDFSCNSKATTRGQSWNSKINVLLLMARKWRWSSETRKVLGNPSPFGKYFGSLDFPILGLVEHIYSTWHVTKTESSKVWKKREELYLMQILSS